MMHGCHKCSTMGALLLIVIGILFLLADLGIWSFWNLSWYTVGFLFVGITGFGHANCPECKSLGKKK